MNATYYIYRTLCDGQRGEVYEVRGERVAVAFNICGLKMKEEEEEEEEYDEKSREKSRQAFLVWLDGTCAAYFLAICLISDFCTYTFFIAPSPMSPAAKDVRRDLEARIHDFFMSMEVLYQVH